MQAATGKKQLTGQQTTSRSRSNSCSYGDNESSENKSYKPATHIKTKTGDLTNGVSARALFADPKARQQEANRSLSQLQRQKSTSKLDKSSTSLATSTKPRTLTRTKSASQVDREKTGMLIKARVAGLNRSRPAVNEPNGSDINANTIGAKRGSGSRASSAKREGAVRSREQDRIVGVSVTSSAVQNTDGEANGAVDGVSTSSRAAEVVIPIDRVERRLNLLHARYAQSLYLATRSQRLAAEMEHRLGLQLAGLVLENVAIRRGVLEAEQSLVFHDEVASRSSSADSQVQSLGRLGDALESEPFKSLFGELGSVAESRRDFLPFDDDNVSLTADASRAGIVSDSDLQVFSETLRGSVDSRPAETSANMSRFGIGNVFDATEHNRRQRSSLEPPQRRPVAAELPPLASTIADTFETLTECVNQAKITDCAYARESSLLASCFERRLLDNNDPPLF